MTLAPSPSNANDPLSAEATAFLTELGRHPAVQKGDVEAVAAFACERCRPLTDVRYASVWMFNPERTALHSILRYDCSTSSTSAAIELQIGHIAGEFAALDKAVSMASDDALNDPRLIDIRDSYLRPQGITALFYRVIRVSGEDLGLLSFEQVGKPRPWQPADAALARGISNYLVLTIVNQQKIHADLILRESEDKRRQSEEVLARVFLQSPDAIVITALHNGQILEANPGFEKITGYSRAEALGRTTVDLGIWVDVAEREHMLALVRATGVVQSLTVHIQQRGGGQRECVLWSRVLEYDDVPALLASVHDVTDMRRAAQTASDSQRMLQAVMDTVPAHVFWKDRDSVYLGCNRQFALDNGFTDPSQIVGTTDYDQLTSRSPEQLAEIETVLAADRELIATGRPTKPRNAIFVMPDGATHWMTVSKTPLLGAAGDVIGILGVQHDITELVKRQDELRASEEKLRAMFTLSPLGITLTSTDGHFLEANDAFLNIIGYRHEDIPDLRYQALTPPEYAASDAQQVRALVVTGRYGPQEKEYVRRDGSRIPVSLNGSLVTGLDGKQYVWSTIEDITSRREAAEAQRRLNEELGHLVAERTADLKTAMEGLMRSEKLASLGSLVAGVAHEISTPVGNASLATSTLVGAIAEFEQKLDGKFSRAALEGFVKQVKLGVDIANRNIERVAGLIQSFKQVAMDQTSSQRRQFHLTEVVDEIVTTMHPSLKRNAVKTEIAVPADLVLDSYPGPLGQVMTNLINNSLVHAFPKEPPGKGRAWTIRIAAEGLDADHLRLDISDNGSGMAASVLSRIFDPFFTSKLGHGGSGLGLHIVHNIVADVLAGTIAVSSDVGSGSIFSITIPRVTPVQEAAGRLGLPS